MTCSQPLSRPRIHGVARYLMLSFLVTLAAAAVGQSHDHVQSRRQAGAHVHGIAQLLVASDGDRLAITLETPAVNVVGFEHDARTEAEREQLLAAERILRDANLVTNLSASAGCEPESVRVSSAQLDALGHPGPVDDHAHDHEHNHDSHQETATHSEFVVDYRFYCTEPDQLSGLTVTAFEHFPGFEAVNVQWALPGGQGAQQVDAARPSVRF